MDRRWVLLKTVERTEIKIKQKSISQKEKREPKIHLLEKPEILSRYRNLKDREIREQTEKSQRSR